MTVAVTIEAVLIAAMAVFIVGLLRSHAEILRRLAAVERGSPQPEAEPSPVSSPPGAERSTDISGRTLTGDSIKLALGKGTDTTLLAFLGSGCSGCEPLWESLRAGVAVPGGARLVVVAKDEAEESLARLRTLAPADRELVLSTQAWRDYRVPASPHFVLVDGPSGTVAGRGTGLRWEQMATLMADAIADLEIAASNGTAGTSARAARAEDALSRAGIGPGHPSLHPPTHDRR